MTCEVQLSLEKYKLFEMPHLFMKNRYVLKIGAKGEIILPKEVRKTLGLTKDLNLCMKVYSDRIVIKKLDDLEQILKKPSEARVSYHVLKNLGDEFD